MLYVCVCVCVCFEMSHWHMKGFSDLDWEKILDFRGDSNPRPSTYGDDALTSWAFWDPRVWKDPHSSFFITKFCESSSDQPQGTGNMCVCVCVCVCVVRAWPSVVWCLTLRWHNFVRLSCYAMWISRIRHTPWFLDSQIKNKLCLINFIALRIFPD